eukprot:3566930-Amphidinium_carterae.1
MRWWHCSTLKGLSDSVPHHLGRTASQCRSMIALRLVRCRTEIAGQSIKFGEESVRFSREVCGDMLTSRERRAAFATMQTLGVIGGCNDLGMVRGIKRQDGHNGHFAKSSVFLSRWNAHVRLPLGLAKARMQEHFLPEA